MKALYRVSDGYIIIENVIKPLTGIKEIASLASEKWMLIGYDQDMFDHVMRGHCVVIFGELQLIPESDWKENQPEVEE